MEKLTNILETEEQTFEFESPIKTKYIDEWDSLIFGLVLLKNGDVYTVVKESMFSDYKMGKKIDENCKFLDLIGDPNYTTPIFKTDNNLHYFIRHNEDIDNDEIDINLYHKIVSLTDELKDNKLIPYYVKKKYSKATDIYSLTYQLTQMTYDEESNDTKLINLSKDYILYDYKKKIIYIDIEDGIKLNIQLDDDSYGGGKDVLRCFQSKKVVGYDKIIYKKNGNYVLFKSKSKTFISLFTDKNWSYINGTADENLFEIKEQLILRGNLKGDYGRGETYFKNDCQNVKNDYSGKGANLFSDKYLPNFIDSVDYGEQLVFGYIESKEKFTIPKSPYESVKKSSFKK